MNFFIRYRVAVPVPDNGYHTPAVFCNRRFCQLQSLPREVDFHLGFLWQVSGNLETKYKVKELGLTFTEKWNTDNTLNPTVDIQDKLLPGLKVSQLEKENLI